MLNCKKVTYRASDYLDGELPLILRSRIMLHLLICSSCRRFMGQLVLVKHLLIRKQPALNEAEVKHLVHISQQTIMNQK